MSPGTVRPGDSSAPPGWLLRVVKDQRVAFLAVGATNTVFGYTLFALLLLLLGHRLYLVALVIAYIISVLLGFVLYRNLVFKVRGHVLADLWRFVTV
ncbi:MAG: GtrA family protein, partial [Actinomycetota bacterium]